LEPNYGGLKYIDTAANSLYGDGVSGLIEYAVWQHKNKKDISYVKPVLDKLLDERKYEETWTLFGKHLNGLYSILQDWIKQNINKIFPEDDSVEFKAAWVTYMICNKEDVNIFDLLKSKFEYALKNKLCIDDKQFIEGLGRHISLNYALNDKINLSLDDNIIMKLTFDIPEILQFMVCDSITKTIKEICLKKEHIQKEIIERVKSLWNRIISEFSKLNDDSKLKYHKALKKFKVWYGCKFFHDNDNEWVLEQMYNLVVKHKIDMGKLFFFVLQKKLC
jgi:hypothetical protein